MSTNIESRLLQVLERLDIIIQYLKQLHPILKSPFDAKELMIMPDHLRKTALTLLKLGVCTAEDIAAITHRARAVESAYLNQLSNTYPEQVNKRREGRKVYFNLTL